MALEDTPPSKRSPLVIVASAWLCSESPLKKKQTPYLAERSVLPYGHRVQAEPSQQRISGISAILGAFVFQVGGPCVRDDEFQVKPSNRSGLGIQYGTSKRALNRKLVLEKNHHLHYCGKQYLAIPPLCLPGPC